jgi:hypothetical protein
MTEPNCQLIDNSANMNSHDLSHFIRAELQLNEVQFQRYHDLEQRLHKNDLNLRLDSMSSLDYIFHGKGRIDVIVRRLKEANYLHEYCDFQRGWADAMKNMPSRISKQARLAFIRKSVLQQTESKYYPFPRDL